KVATLHTGKQNRTKQTFNRIALANRIMRIILVVVCTFVNLMAKIKQTKRISHGRSGRSKHFVAQREETARKP
ncbi:MAG: hypothetical protein J1E07_11020, partial [Treponema sp.]|nr:hypothetical protein [Treponema sp.]